MLRPDSARPNGARPLLVLGKPPARLGVEIAASPRARAFGLMFREHLRHDEGMLFVFEQPGLHTFWMLNTFVPLDLVFMDGAGRVVGVVEHAEPQSQAPLGVETPSELVLEVAAGFVARHRVTVGSVAQLPDLPSKEPA